MGTGEDEYGNYYNSPAGQSHIKNSWTSADTKEARERHKWCVKRMRAMKKPNKRLNLTP